MVGRAVGAKSMAANREGGKTMNVVMWILAGGLLGWLGCAYLGYNEQRGIKVSVIIGIAGSFLGGKLIAPLFISAAAVPADFSVSTLFVAALVAASFLFVGNAVN